MGIDDLVDLVHDADRLVQGDDDPLVVGDVLCGERATLTVLQPLLADLVAADVEVPDLLGHAAEADASASSSSQTVLVGMATFSNLQGWPGPCRR